MMSWAALYPPSWMKRCHLSRSLSATLSGGLSYSIARGSRSKAGPPTLTAKTQPLKFEGMAGGAMRSW